MRRALCLAALLLAPAAARSADPPPPLAEKYLTAGRLADGIRDLTAHLEQHPDDAQARFGLGVVQFLHGVEHLAQALYRHGLKSHQNQFLLREVPFLRLPLPENPRPAAISDADFRGIFQRLLDDLAAAEATLARVPDGDVKLPLHFGLIRLDLNGDGKAEEGEELWRLYAAYNRAARIGPGDARDFYICFDAGDVHWLRGYCHLLMAFGEFVLAHDWHELLECTGHLFFAKVKTPHDFLATGPKLFPEGDTDIADLISLIHLVRMPVKEPKRMAAALHHLEAMIAQARVMWKLILAETDDDHEWIPNPKQSSVIANVRVTKEMVDGWLAFLDQAEELLQGKKLIPFWRGGEGVGVNLRRVFLEPRPFDLVLWVQGTAATPYLEKGPCVTKQDWDRLQRLFGGEFVTFAFWFN